jgi:predicted ATPase/DNA-binding CsgD family transcriptional regulator
MLVQNMPYAAAPFLNRVSEIAEVSQRLSNAECRLLTLVGPGGIGKTRLAMRVAVDCADQFDDGVYFVPLQPMDSSEFLVSTIIKVVSPQSQLGNDPRQQLLQYLQGKEMLLVLDNFEHLLDGSDLLTEMLVAAPEVKLLVTSREVLNLQEEWLFLVRGLDYPETDVTEQPGAYSAVQLFVERARKVRGNLSLPAEQAGIIRVCQLVEGMPLALELAAVWAKAMPTNEIALEIQRSLGFLSTSLRNVPQRHQSITAVFEQTWRRLSDEEQRVFRALSVFSGGFRREAAQAVADVSLRLLSDLVDKSLLTSQPDGRYQIHELLRQFAEAHLEGSPDETFRVHDLHAAYYMRFLNERGQDLIGARQREASLEIEADLDNIRAAWSWVVEHARVEAIDQAQHALLMFYPIQSRVQEAVSTFEKAAQMLDNGDVSRELSLAAILASLGIMGFHAFELEKARVAAERSWQIYSQHGVLPEPGRGVDPRMALCYAYLYMGININIAEQLTRDALQDHILRGDSFSQAQCYSLLANFVRLQGKYEESRQFAQQGYACTEATGELLVRSWCLRFWGIASLLLNDIADAKRRFQASVAIDQSIKHLVGMADTLGLLGSIALNEGDSTEARRCYEQAWTLYNDLGNKIGLSTALEGMGNSACAIKHYQEARRYLREALQVESPYMASRIPSLLSSVGDLFLQTGKRARGIELFALALHHPASAQDTKDRVQWLATRYQATEEVMQQTSPNVDFNAVTSALLDELLISEDTRLTRHTPHAGEVLIEPLSERELEVLTLVADGLSNREIADTLYLSVGTVKWYLTHIYGKLGVESRTLAIVRARQLNLLA